MTESVREPMKSSVEPLLAWHGGPLLVELTLQGAPAAVVAVVVAAALVVAVGWLASASPGFCRSLFGARSE
eukprot:12600784-Alexandrium_andersonii.AAC.2